MKDKHCSFLCNSLRGEGKTTYLLSASFRIYKNNTLHNTLMLPSPPDPCSPPAGNTLTALTRYFNVLRYQLNLRENFYTESSGESIRCFNHTPAWVILKKVKKHYSSFLCHKKSFNAFLFWLNRWRLLPAWRTSGTGWATWTGTWGNVKNFFVRNLQIFIVSKSVCPWQAFPAWCNICG
jgi:hypothetical protein